MKTYFAFGIIGFALMRSLGYAEPISASDVTHPVLPDKPAAAATLAHSGVPRVSPIPKLTDITTSAAARVGSPAARPTGKSALPSSEHSARISQGLAIGGPANPAKTAPAIIGTVNPAKNTAMVSGTAMKHKP